MKWSTAVNDMAVEPEAKKGLLREGGAMRRALQEGDVGYVLIKSNKR